MTLCSVLSQLQARECPVTLCCPSTPELLLHRALARRVGPGYRVQVAPVSAGTGPQLLFTCSAQLPRTHPTLPLSQLLPHLPARAGPVPCPGRGWWSPTETDQRKVRMQKGLVKQVSDACELLLTINDDIFMVTSLHQLLELRV